MNAETLKMLLRMHPPGQRVRFKDAESVRETFAKHGAPAIPAEGLVLQVLPDASAPVIGDLVPAALGVLVEFPVGDRWDMAVFSPSEIEPQPIDHDALERELVGRVVSFPRSSGIGIAFPSGASDLGVIAAARHEHGWIRLTVAVDVAGRETPFITAADFTQCTLKIRDTKPR